jgi:hypothetical protein
MIITGSNLFYLYIYIYNCVFLGGMACLMAIPSLITWASVLA